MDVNVNERDVGRLVSDVGDEDNVGEVNDVGEESDVGDVILPIEDDGLVLESIYDKLLEQE
jgi:hypothetical protein